MSSDSVVAFLKCRGLAEYVDLFAENGFMDMEDLVRLEDSDLKQLGIEKMGHRMKILRELKAVADGADSMSPVRCPAPDASFDREQSGHHLTASSSGSPGRRRSRTHGPTSPAPALGEGMHIRSAPHHQYGGDKIVIELLAAKLEVGGDVNAQVKVSLCKTVDQKGVPMEKTVRRSTLQPGTQPRWNEVFEVPAVISEQTYLVIAVNNKAGMTTKRVGLVAIPTKFFQPFTDATVVDNWFPIKVEQGVRTGEIHLRLRVPGGIPSQTGKAFKVTGVKMEQQKLQVEVIEAEVPLGSKGKPRSAYVKLTLPDKLYVSRETGIKKTQRPKWFEGFTFFSEVKQSQYLLVKLKKWARLQHITMGIAKIPLMFFLSLKDKMVLDNWYPCRDQDGKEQGRVRVRMLVKPRSSSEHGLYWAPDDSYLVTDAPKVCPANVPQPQEPRSPARRRRPGSPRPGSPRSPAKRRSAFPADSGVAAGTVIATEDGRPLVAHHEDPMAEEEEGEAEEAEEYEELEEGVEEEYEELEEGPEEEAEEDEAEAEEGPAAEKEDDTFCVHAHDEDFSSFSPTHKGKGQVHWPPAEGDDMPDGVVRDMSSPPVSPPQ